MWVDFMGKPKYDYNPFSNEVFLIEERKKMLGRGSTGVYKG